MISTHYNLPDSSGVHYDLVPGGIIAFHLGNRFADSMIEYQGGLAINKGCSMKILVWAFAGLMVLGGCVNTVDGKMEVTQLFSASLRDPSCVPGQGGSCPVRQIQVAPGTYDAKLRVQGERQVVLEISVNGSPKSIPILIPRRVRFPEYEGQVKVSSAEIDQAFDIEVTLNSTFQNSDPIQNQESCIETVSELQCYQTPEGHSNCRLVVVHYPGQQEVEYYIENIRKTLHSSLLKPGTEEVIAILTGTQNLANRHYTYVSECSRFRRRR